MPRVFGAAYENDPSAYSVKVPTDGAAASVADNVVPSESESLASTPGAATESVCPTMAE